MTVVLEWLGRIYDFLKANIGKIYLLIIYLKDRKIADQKRVIEALERENKETADAIKAKKESDKKTKTAQDKIDALKKPAKNLIILFMFLFASCGTTKIIYETQYVKPDLIKLHLCPDRNFEQDEEIEYCNECILYYEKQLHIYSAYRDSFLAE